MMYNPYEPRAQHTQFHLCPTRGSMTFRRFFSATGLFVALLLPTHIPAQSSNASIAGAVSDSSGGALSGADLTLKATDSAKVSKAISGADGLFSFPNLP